MILQTGIWKAEQRNLYAETKNGLCSSTGGLGAVYFPLFEGLFGLEDGGIRCLQAAEGLLDKRMVIGSQLQTNRPVCFGWFG